MAGLLDKLEEFNGFRVTDFSIFIIDKGQFNVCASPHLLNMAVTLTLMLVNNPADNGQK